LNVDFIIGIFNGVLKKNWHIGAPPMGNESTHEQSSTQIVWIQFFDRFSLNKTQAYITLH
jgi:hypothetical protein